MKLLIDIRDWSERNRFYYLASILDIAIDQLLRDEL